MSRTIPLSNLKNTTGIVNYCKECKVPIFVTRNGAAEMVIMDSDFYDEYLSAYLICGNIDIVKVLEYFPQFMNIRDLKNTGELSKRVAESKQAIPILKNGMAELVIMNMEVYNRYRENALKDLKENQKHLTKLIIWIIILVSYKNGGIYNGKNIWRKDSGIITKKRHDAKRTCYYYRSN